jgi:hypothetical protein
MKCHLRRVAQTIGAHFTLEGGPSKLRLGGAFLRPSQDDLSGMRGEHLSPWQRGRTWLTLMWWVGARAKTGASTTQDTNLSNSMRLIICAPPCGLP